MEEVESQPGGVPCVLWTPRLSAAAPVVLLGHGGGGSKRSDRHERVARRLTSEGIACLAIDGPFHGDRGVAGDGPQDYQRRVVLQGPVRVHEQMRDDWLLALRSVARDGSVDPDRVGFLGMSMGTRYGLMVCAALGDALRCAVLGKFGLHSTPHMALMASDHAVREAAQRITAPVLLHVQWDDEVFTRDGQLELFDQLSSPHKQLRGRQGTHGTTDTDDEDAWCDYLTGHLLNP